MLIYGTGFQASKFLTPMKVTGRDGVDLHEQWGGDARAYLGVTVPGFPNLFCLYGPNTNIVINGSIVYFSECGVRYILGCLELLLRGGHRAARRAQGRARRVQRAGRRREPGDGVGLVRREQLVQERARPRRAELAVHAARVLAAHAARPTPTTTSSSTLSASTSGGRDHVDVVLVHSQRRQVHVAATGIPDVRLREGMERDPG